MGGARYSIEWRSFSPRRDPIARVAVESVRPVEASDADRCFELLTLAIAELDGRRGGALLARQASGARIVSTASELVGALDDPDYLNLVGEFANEVVGMAQGHIEHVGSGVLHGIVDAYYVEPSARGVGVGEALLGSVLDWFADRDCAGVDALALPGDRQAKRFFEAHGFKTRLLVMHKETADAGDTEVARDGAGS